MIRARPTAAALRALDIDDWASLLSVALPVVRSLPDLHVDATVKRLRALQVGRLVNGRSRDDLAEVLARRPVWDAVERALPADAPRPWTDVDARTVDDAAAVAELTADRDALRGRVTQLEDRERRLEERLRSTREELDETRRATAGAEARARRAEQAAEVATARLAELEAEVATAARRLAEADAERDRAVARAARRDAAEDRERDVQLRDARREVDALRREVGELTEQLAARPAAAAPDRASTLDEVDPRDTGRRGRPSTLPVGIVAGTREAAQWLVQGRVLLVDGYNVTKSLRPDEPLHEQRRWLEQAVGVLAQRRHVEATIVWDSTLGAGTATRHRSGLTVRFTEPDVIADDDLVLHARMSLAPDTPAVAVTDDRELRDRLAALGIDLLDTRSFGWLL